MQKQHLRYAITAIAVLAALVAVWVMRPKPERHHIYYCFSEGQYFPCKYLKTEFEI